MHEFPWQQIAQHILLHIKIVQFFNYMQLSAVLNSCFFRICVWQLSQWNTHCEMNVNINCAVVSQSPVQWMFIRHNTLILIRCCWGVTEKRVCELKLAIYFVFLLGPVFIFGLLKLFNWSSQKSGFLIVLSVLLFVWKFINYLTINLKASGELNKQI